MCVCCCCSVVQSFMVWCMLSGFSHVRLFTKLWTIACLAPVSMELSRQEYWNGLPLPTPGALPDSGIEPESLASPALAVRFFTTAPPWKPVPWHI